MSEPNDFTRSMEEAFPVEEARALMPAGPQQITIDDRPRGAMKLEVRRDPPGIILRDLKQLAQAAGDDFFYRWPVKAKLRDENGKEYWGTDWVEGPSVKCAMAVARRYGNCQVRVRAFDQGNHWMLHAVFFDAETGYTLERPFQQRKSQNVGEKMNADRAADLIFQIGTSKATRNVIVNGVPEFVNYAFLEAKGAIVTKIGEKPDVYKARIRQRLDELKVDVKRVEMRHGRTLDKWLVPDMASIIAEIQSVNDGMADADEMWPAAQIDLPQDRPREENYRTSDQSENLNTAPSNETAKSDMGQNAQNPAGGKPQQTAADSTVGAGTAGQAQADERGPSKPEETGSTPAARSNTRAYDDGLGMIEMAEQSFKAGEIDHTAGALGELKAAIKANINALPDLDDDDRSRLHGKWSGIVLGFEAELSRKKGGKR